MSYPIKIIIAILYVISGIYVMFMEVMPGNIDPNFQRMVGFVLICYGVYRGVYSQYVRNMMEKSNYDKEKNTGK